MEGMFLPRSRECLHDGGSISQRDWREIARKSALRVVLLEGIELSTSPLPRGCSTAELQQRRRRASGEFLDAAGAARKPRRRLTGAAALRKPGHPCRMNAMTVKPTRQRMPERRADYLRFERIPTRWMDNDAYRHVTTPCTYSFFDTVVNRMLIEAGV